MLACDQHRVLAVEADPGAPGALSVDVLVLVHEDAIAAAEQAAQRLEALAQERVVVTPGVAREAALAGPGLRRVGPVAEGRGDDGPRGAVEQQLGMARDVRTGHREPHVGEEPPAAPLQDLRLGVRVWLGGRRADHVEAELVGTSCELGGPHARIVPVKAIRIHEDGGPEVLRYEDVPDPEPGQGEVLVRLAAASLNHLDVWVRKGLPSVPKPRILGADGAGVVAALGGGVEASRSATAS